MKSLSKTKKSKPSQRHGGKVDEVVAILERFQKQTPEPRCELYYETPFQLLVSVVLSAQATDKSVNAAMADLYRSGLTIDTILNWGEQGLLQRIRRIGLAPTKARNILKLCAQLKERHQSEVPHNREALEALPGVGRKTANVVLAEIFHEPTLAVDTHVFRVGRRLGWHKATMPEKAEIALLKAIPEKYLPRAHHWLILHGRYHCTARAPKCETCIVADLCPKIGCG